MLLGNKIKSLRDEQEVSPRSILLNIGVSISKRNQVILLAKYFNVDEKEMLTLWLADKVLDAVVDEEETELKRDAIEVAKETILQE